MNNHSHFFSLGIFLSLLENTLMIIAGSYGRRDVLFRRFVPAINVDISVSEVDVFSLRDHE